MVVSGGHCKEGLAAVLDHKCFSSRPGDLDSNSCGAEDLLVQWLSGYLYPWVFIPSTTKKKKKNCKPAL